MSLGVGSTLLGRYQILRLIGQGGMGTVYAAFDQQLKHQLAIKYFRGQDAVFQSNLEREAQLLARLRHPALPRVYDLQRVGDAAFLIMELIEGENLGTLLAQRGAAFEPDVVLAWANALAPAISYLHHQTPPVIHRDIKPQNILRTPEGQLMLVDFGLAKQWASSTQSVVAYTLAYAALEQIQATSPVNQRSDVYSFAATLYHLPTNCEPADALTRASSLINGQPDPLLSADLLNSAVSPSLAAALHNGLALAAHERPASIDQLMRQLQQGYQNQALLSSAGQPTIVQRQAVQTIALSTATKPAVSAQQILQPQRAPQQMTYQETTDMEDPFTRFIVFAAVFIVLALIALCFYGQSF
ncbi:serine/threonine-protein kinase [Herpetosiphon giganteus]|uniref:serine/threonine-protein kinase n=1 Tax=Herpetosiphon giganteus TaxID=2029754 RepID=UPI00195D38AA|nr:serine/threonine-protein kinase [Herpetosiphon giganteus]MBM7841977.1 serine/threonine protein kinase [Herpetosiphon giganteus]